MSTLAGKRVVVTRAAHQADEMASLLRERGAIPLLYPCIEILPPEDTTALDAAVRTAANGDFDWLVLTSVNTVMALAARLSAIGLPDDALKALRAAAVGSETAGAAREQLGVEVSAMPDTSQTESLVQTIGDVQGARILLPQSALADDTMRRSLEGRGAHVTRVEAYRNGIGSGGVDVPAMIDDGTLDVITFTSGSTVRNFLARLAGKPLSENVCVACIGLKTTGLAQALGLHVTVMSTLLSLEGLVDALESHFRRSS